MTRQRQTRFVSVFSTERELWANMLPHSSPTPKTSSSSSPAPASVSASAYFRGPGQQQEYSCILCKQRKVRCDRGNPCSGCVRAGVDCVPGVRQPYKRRKRIHPRETDNSVPTGDFYSTTSRVVDSRPVQDDPRPQQPQIPTFGQYECPLPLTISYIYSLGPAPFLLVLSHLR